MKDKGLNIIFLLLLPIVDTVLCVVLLMLNLSYNEIVKTILVISSMIASSCAGIAATIEFVKDYYDMEKVTIKRIVLLVLSLGLHLIIDAAILTHNYHIVVLSIFAYSSLPISVLLLILSIKSSLSLKEIATKKREEEIGFNPKITGQNIDSMESAVVDNEEYNLEGDKNEN